MLNSLYEVIQELEKDIEVYKSISIRHFGEGNKVLGEKYFYYATCLNNFRRKLIRADEDNDRLRTLVEYKELLDRRLVNE